VLAPFLIPVFAIVFMTIDLSDNEGVVAPHWMGFIILVFFVGMIAVYCYGLYAIIRATRMPQSTRLHPGRAHMAALLVVLGLLIPILVVFLAFATLQSSASSTHSMLATLAILEKDNYHNEMQRYDEQVQAIVQIRKEIGAKMGEISGENREEREAYDSAGRSLDQKQHELSDNRMSSSRFNPSVVGPEASVGIIIFPFPLFFVLPGTILGIGYVARIRREKERPGLGWGLFAALTFPIVLMLGGTVALILVFGFTGFLIMLAIIGLLVGTYFAVRYWLRN